MADQVIDRLARENPVPGGMAELPIEVILERLDDAPYVAPARQRRPRRFTAAVPLALSLIVSLAVAAFVLSSVGHQASRHHVVAPASRGPDASEALLDYLFPRNGADWATGGALEHFVAAVRTKAETQCMAAGGLPGPPVYGQPSQQYGSVQFPNMPVIERTNNVGVTTLPAPTDPAKHLSSSKRSAYTAALSSCQARGAKPVAFLGKPAWGLMTRWMSIFTKVSASQAVRAANRRAAACSASTPFPAGTVGQEIEAVEAKLTPLYIRGHNAQARALNASGVRVLVRCFGAVEALRNQLMAAERVGFLASHARAIRKLERQASRGVAADEAKYGVRLSSDSGS